MGDNNKKVSGATADQKSNFGAKGWLVVVFAMVLFFLGGALVNDGMNAIIPALAEKNGFNPGALSAMNTVGGWIGFVGAVVFGVIAEKRGAKETIVYALILGAVSVFFWGRITTIAGYALIISLVNIAQNGFMQVGPSTLAANWFPKKKGLAMGWMTMGCNVSTAISVRILTGLMENGGIEGAFNKVCVFMVIVAVFCLFFIKSNPEEAGAYPDNDKNMTPEMREQLFKLGKAYEKTSTWTTGKLLKCKTVWMIGIAYGIIIMITMGTVSQLVPTIISRGFSQTAAVNMMTVAAVIGIIFSYLFGVLDAKLGTKRASLVFYVWTGLAVLFMALPFTWSIYPAVFFMGGFLGAGNNLTMSITATVFGRYDFSKAWTVIFPITVLVRSCGYGLVGVLADRTGGYTVPYIVLLVCAVIAFILIYVMDDSMLGRNYISEEEINKAMDA